MSLDEINVLLKASNENKKTQWEIARKGWFYSLIAPGFSKVKSPEDLIIFNWEKNKKEK